MADFPPLWGGALWQSNTTAPDGPNAQIQSADAVQAGGDHYKRMGVQPWHVMESVLTPEEFIGYLKGNIIKYGMRQGAKDSPDAEKCHHYRLKLDEVLSKLGEQS